MSLKHSKKRNTALIYECLVRETTKQLYAGDNEKAKYILGLIREYFAPGTVLYKELKIYNELKPSSLEPKYAEKILQESKNAYSKLNKQEIFNEQTKIIGFINKKISPAVFDNFVSNYKYMASLSQVFNDTVGTKAKVMLEDFILETVTQKEVLKEEKVIDTVTYNIFAKKFNEKYTNSLLKEQKELLSKYINSNDNDGKLEFNIYINEEIERLKNLVAESLSAKEINVDKNMKEKTNKILEFLNEFKTKEPNKQSLEKILKIQEFVNEVQKSD